MGFFQNYIVQIVIACAIPFIGAWSIGFSAQRNMHPWYDHIVRPSWGPPDWVFGPVWTFLYLSMGYASFRVWSEGRGFSGIAKVPLILYIIQLLLNWTWTQVFFGFHLFGLATIHIITLLGFIIMTGLSFYQVDQIAGVLFIPYTAWVSFASILSFTLWRLNT